MNFIKKSVKKATQFADTVVNRRDGLSPQVKDQLSRKGDAIIYSMKVGRTPVNSVITGIIKIVSSTPYDTLFHLFIQMETSNGMQLIEKNAVIHMGEGKATDIAGAEWMDVPNVPQITVNQLVENTRNQMGDGFIPYSAYKHNCQDFVSNVLTANGMNDQSVLNFVRQDTDGIFKTHPNFRKFANSVTNLGASADVVMQGGELHRRFKKNELTDGQILHIMNGYHIPFHGCFIKNKLPARLSNGFYIINLNGQSHWTALVKNGKHFYYFDSFGCPPPTEVLNKILPQYIYNQFDIQDIDSSSCGWYCIAFLRYMHHNKVNLEKSFVSFINLFSSNTRDNELVLKSLLM